MRGRGRRTHTTQYYSAAARAPAGYPAAPHAQPPPSGRGQVAQRPPTSAPRRLHTSSSDLNCQHSRCHSYHVQTRLRLHTGAHCTYWSGRPICRGASGRVACCAARNCEAQRLSATHALGLPSCAGHGRAERRALRLSANELFPKPDDGSTGASEGAPQHGRSRGRESLGGAREMGEGAPPLASPASHSLPYHLTSRFLRFFFGPSAGRCLSQSTHSSTYSSPSLVCFSFSTMCTPARRAHDAWNAVRQRGARHWMFAPPVTSHSEHVSSKRFSFTMQLWMTSRPSASRNSISGTHRPHLHARAAAEVPPPSTAGAHEVIGRSRQGSLLARGGTDGAALWPLQASRHSHDVRPAKVGGALERAALHRAKMTLRCRLTAAGAPRERAGIAVPVALWDPSSAAAIALLVNCVGGVSGTHEARWETRMAAAVTVGVVRANHARGRGVPKPAPGMSHPSQKIIASPSSQSPSSHTTHSASSSCPRGAATRPRINVPFASRGLARRAGLPLADAMSESRWSRRGRGMPRTKV